jgi:hypothetical protein
MKNSQQLFQCIIIKKFVPSAFKLPHLSFTSKRGWVMLKHNVPNKLLEVE